MSVRYVLYDDAVARTMEPFSLTRPLCEVTAGAMLIRDRWARILGGSAAGVVSSPHLERFDEDGAARLSRGTLRAGTVVVNTRFAPALAQPGGGVTSLEPGTSLRAHGEVVAVALATPLPVAILADGKLPLADLPARAGRTVEGWWIGNAWDFVALLPEMLGADSAVLAADAHGEPPAHVAVLGAHRLVLEPGAYAEPYVVADTTGGDVVVRSGARIGAFARIAGPAVIDEGARLGPGRYSCVSIGRQARVCGELSVVTVGAYSNKAHDGFVGHSALGRWVNLGAGTITSNLKNTYGSIRVRDARGEHDTAQQFLGSLIGDHAKTAIGTRLVTGTIVGAGANIVGDRTPDKYVPPFAWGDRAPFAKYEITRFLDVAARVMKRREMRLSKGMRAVLAAAAEASAQVARGGRPGRRTHAGTSARR
ncbi:MAG: hypothetical protein IT356_00455 [Gemmatimonadaceae bacterium]|nr:hypothetical protein [Gemmatimonadaceae bacterium]